MTLSTAALELHAFDSLPRHTRRCVFWEVDAETGDPVLLDGPGVEKTVGYESEFDKEAWVSGLLLEWGACCQVAVSDDTGAVIGSAFYAPPGRVPRSRRFPSGPVSSDAVLLTKVITEPGFETAAPLLLDAVVADLVRRGVRAVEAFGLSAHPEEPLAMDLVGLLLGGGSRANVCEACLTRTEFLTESGFEVVAPDRYLPRLRLELGQQLGWKAEVERALEKLVRSEVMEFSGTGSLTSRHVHQ